MKNLLFLYMVFLLGISFRCFGSEKFVDLGGCKLALDETYSCINLEESAGMLCNAYVQNRAISLTFYPISYSNTLESRAYVSSEEIATESKKLTRYLYDLSGKGDLLEIFVMKGADRILEINAQKSLAIKMAESCQ